MVNQRLNQILMIIFLLLIVIGFTVPAFLYNDEETVQAQPRVCQSDSDCYLLCNEKPVMILCSQNLCQQNACEEKNNYEKERFAFNTTPHLINLELDLNKTKIELTNLTLPGNLFVRPKNGLLEGKLELYNQYLSLNQILEKFQTKLEGQCLKISSPQSPQQYCSNPLENKTLKVFVNGEQNYAYGNYIPEEGDKIEIVY